MDKVPREVRSDIMRQVKSRNTRPELVIRKALHRKGFRFRLHNAGLPGKPDIVFPKYRKILLIHGCFWHRHENCRHASTPASNTEYWTKKFNKNVSHDSYVINALSELGWSVRVVWECEIRLRSKFDTLIEDLASWLRC